MWHFLGFPFFFVCFFDDHGSFPFGGSACKIFGRNQALMEICKEVFLEVFLPYNYYIIITVYTSQQGKRK